MAPPTKQWAVNHPRGRTIMDHPVVCQSIGGRPAADTFRHTTQRYYFRLYCERPIRRFMTQSSRTDSEHRLEMRGMSNFRTMTRLLLRNDE